MANILNSASPEPDLPDPDPARDSELEWLLCLASAYQLVNHKANNATTLPPKCVFEPMLQLLKRILPRAQKAS